MGKDHPLWRKGVVGGHGGAPMARRTRMASQPTAASATEVARRHGASCAPAGGARCVRASAATWRGRKGGSFAGCERAARVVSLLDGVATVCARVSAAQPLLRLQRTWDSGGGWDGKKHGHRVAAGLACQGGRGARGAVAQRPWRGASRPVESFLPFHPCSRPRTPPSSASG